MIKIEHAYSPKQYARSVEVWRRVIDLDSSSMSRGPYGMHLEAIEDEHLYELILSDGAETKDVESVKVTLISYSDYRGDDFDAANVRAIEQGYSWVGTETDGVHGHGEAWLQLGELPYSPDGDIDWQLDVLEEFVAILEGLSEYSAIDYELHSQYVEELGFEHWDQYLGSDVLSHLRDELCGYDGDFDDFGFSDDNVKDLYYNAGMFGGPESDWYCDSATHAVNGRHDQTLEWIADHIVKVWRTPVYDPNQLSLEV
jgi:hypothetical protein